MDGLDLINHLEDLRGVVPDFLRDDYEGLIQNVRNIYEQTVRLITPTDPVNDGKQNLTAHYTTLDDHSKELEKSLTSFKIIYQGQGSDAYHSTSAMALTDMKILRDHMALAGQTHIGMSTNFGIALDSQVLLVIALGAIVIAGTTFIFSGGILAEIDIPAMIAAGWGTVAEILSIDTAIAAVTGLLATLAETTIAALPILLTLGAVAAVGVIVLSGDAATPTAQSYVHPIVLTKYPELDPSQEEAAKELAREFGSDVNLKWIQYLIHVLGLKGLTADQAKSVIRCLQAKGYMDITVRLNLEAQKYNADPASLGLDQKNNKDVIDAFKSAWNALMDQLNPRTLQGAWAENNGIDTTIPGLGPKDHVTKAANGIKSLENAIEELQNKIDDYKTQPALRTFYKQLRDFLIKSRDFANNLRNGGRTNGPSTWENPRGEAPFGSDMLESSGCL